MKATLLSIMLVALASAIIQPRQKAPQFSDVNAVIDGAFKKLSSSSYKGKYFVLLFYPFDFTYVCPTELIAFSDSIARFQELDT